MPILQQAALTVTAALLATAVHPLAAQRLRVLEFTSDSATGHVVSAAIVGPTEMVVVDARYYWSDARHEADSLAKLGRKLKAIFITHPHEDHYFGAAALVERFPGTPVYMTAGAIPVFQRTSGRFLESLRKSNPAELPDSFVTPRPLPSMVLTVDGERLEITPDRQGDVYARTNSFVWIPSIRTVIAGDIVFNQIHAWLGSTDSTTRAQWHQSIAAIAALHPAAVVAGHKDPAAPDAPGVLAAMDRYLSDFDRAVAGRSSADTIFARMRSRYPTYAGLDLLRGSAQAAAPHSDR